MQLFQDTGGPGIGLFFASNGPVKAFNRTGSATAIGELMVFDLVGGQAETSSVDPGVGTSAANYGLAGVTAPAAASLTGAADGEMTVFCVAKEVVADNAEVKVDVFGITKGLCINSAGSTTPWEQGVGNTSGQFSFVGTGTGKLIAIYHDATADLTSVTLKTIFLNGYAGLFGSQRV